MIPKKNKFTKKDFSLYQPFVLKKTHSPIGVFYFFDEKFPKSAIVVSNKHFQNVPQRNYIKRVFFNFLKENKNTHLLFFLKGKTTGLTLKEELYRIVKINTK